MTWLDDALLSHDGLQTDRSITLLFIGIKTSDFFSFYLR